MLLRASALPILFVLLLNQANCLLQPYKHELKVPIHGQDFVDHLDVDSDFVDELWEQSFRNISAVDQLILERFPDFGPGIKSFYLPIHASSGECLAAISDLEEPQARPEAKSFVDSWGKWPDGYLWGNTQPLGMFEECLDVENENLNFQGRYCFVMITPLESSTQKSSKQFTNLEPRTGFIFGRFKAPFPYNYGTCVPDACDTYDLSQSLGRTLAIMRNPMRAEVHCHRLRTEEVDLGGGDISFIVFLSVMGFLLLLAAIFDVYTEIAQKKELRTTGIGRLVMPFSFYTNLRKVFAISDTHSKDSITCLYGMRTITLLWVMLGHQYLYSLFYLNQNTADLANKTDSALFMVVANASFSADTFFFMSGLLVAITSMRHMKRNKGRLNFLIYYIHRYIRMTPAIALVVWYQATIMRHFIHGPISFYSERVTESCSRNWWSYLLYVNNFVVDYEDPYDSKCLEQAWYTAIDTQLYILAPLVLIPLFHFKKWGKALLAFIIFAEGIVAGAVTVAFDLSAWGKINVEENKMLQFIRIIYTDPFLRCGPYLVGIAIGYFLYSNSQKRIKLKHWQLALGWILCAGVCFLLIFGIYPLYKLDPFDEGETSPGIQFFYGGFSRTIWACAMAWIVIVCYHGYGGPINTFLSHGYFQPLSRLTYTMYLLSVGVLYCILWSAKVPLYFNHINKLVETAGTVFITFGAAILATLLIETTTLGLENEFLGKWRTVSS